ncbi:MAG: BspA family leucine-rich repeat surface protein [Erysipelotrichaceae bacterium]|nr:BspA family leucine-rich repeat surface protein [Erysipelotrichaceae bacterium]
MRTLLVFVSLYTSLFILPTPCEDSYIIQIPQTIDLSESESFEIRIIQNDLQENEILHIVMPETFTLQDSHGHSDITGQVVNNLIDIEAGQLESQTVTCEVPSLPVGDWYGILCLSLNLERRIPSNVLIKGEDLNDLLKREDIQNITFDNVEHSPSSYYTDVSLAQDGSIRLYLDGNDAYISNTLAEPIIANPDMSKAFADLSSLTAIYDLDHVDFSPCLNMAEMFADNRYLATIEDYENIDTSNVTDMSLLFADCISLSSLDLNSWDVSAVLNASGMFEGCKVSSLTLSGWDTGNILDSSRMFYNCSELISLSISNWDTANITNMSEMFAYCSKLKSLSLANWDISRCQNLHGLFDHCLAMTSTGDLSGWILSDCSDTSAMFSDCGKLRNVGLLNNWDTSNVINMSKMFANCSKLSSIGDLSAWDVSRAEDLSYLFANATQLSNIGNLSLWQVSDNCVDLSYMFQNALALLPSDLDLRNWDVSNVVDMSHMFENAPALTTLNISGWDTGKLENAAKMFAYDQTGSLSRLSNIYGLEDIDVSSLKNISYIFYENQYLSADLSTWNTASLEDISYAFYGTYRFDINKLKHWNVSSVSDMTQAFGDNAGSFVQSQAPDWYH